MNVLLTIGVSVGVTVLTIVGIILLVRLGSKDLMDFNEVESELRDETIKTVKDEIKPIKDDLNSLKLTTELNIKGTATALKSKMYNLYIYCSESKGYTDYNDRETFEDLYVQYNTITQNWSPITKLHEKFVGLPTKEEVEGKK